MSKIFVAAFFVLFLIAGCNKVETATDKDVSQQKKLVIGLLPEHNIFFQLERYEPLVKYLSGKIGIRVELIILSRYGNIINNFVSGKMDGAFFGSFTYALAHSKLGLEIMARPENIEGISTYYGLIFTRKDSRIRTAKDMEGKIFAFVDKATTAGYLLPQAYFKKHGIENYKNYLKETYFTGTHEGVINDVISGKADIGAAKDTVFYRVAKNNSRIMDELVVLERSPDVPENGLAVRKDLDVALKNKIKKALLDMHNDASGKEVLKKFGAKRFIKTTTDDYEPVFEYAKEIGLDLATYDYLNE